MINCSIKHLIIWMFYNSLNDWDVVNSVELIGWFDYLMVQLIFLDHTS
jgi:hypothetical protein